jgi:hypothetical protein
MRVRLIVLGFLAGLSTADAEDKLNLDGAEIRGNRELPKVLNIVPWKGAEGPELVGRPVESLLDEALTPVDRDVFQRTVAYHGLLAKPEKQVGQ